MIILHELLSVTETAISGNYLLRVDATDFTGQRGEYPFHYIEGDEEGLGPQATSALKVWLELGRAVEPYRTSGDGGESAPPPDLTPRQFWKAASAIGITESSLLADLGDPQSPLFIPDEQQREDASIDVSKATSFSRGHHLMMSLPAAYSITPEQLDSLWLWASQLT